MLHHSNSWCLLDDVILLNVSVDVFYYNVWWSSVFFFEIWHLNLWVMTHPGPALYCLKSWSAVIIYYTWFFFRVANVEGSYESFCSTFPWFDEHVQKPDDHRSCAESYRQSGDWSGSSSLGCPSGWQRSGIGIWSCIVSLKIGKHAGYSLVMTSNAIEHSRFVSLGFPKL